MPDATDTLDASTPVAAIAALDAPPRTQESSYPPVFAAQMGGRQKRALGEVFGLRNFGVNLTTLAPGA
ncbi:cupin, partial [Xanthomonas perforans]